MNQPQGARTRRESRGETGLARIGQMQHAPSSGPIRTRGSTSWDRIGQRGVGDNYDSLVHNALDYHLDTPGLTSDRYLVQPSAQLSSYDLVEAQRPNQQDNQVRDPRPAMEHRLLPISGSFGSQHNARHDVTRVYQAAHTFAPPSSSQPMSMHESSAPELASLPGISDLRYRAHPQPEEPTPPYVSGHPVGYGSEHHQQPDLYRQQQYSYGGHATSYEHQDGYPNRQQSDRWRQMERMPHNAVDPERYQLGHPSQLQQPEHWQFHEAPTANAPLYAADQEHAFGPTHHHHHQRAHSLTWQPYQRSNGHARTISTSSIPRNTAAVTQDQLQNNQPSPPFVQAPSNLSPTSPLGLVFRSHTEEPGLFLRFYTPVLERFSYGSSQLVHYGKEYTPSSLWFCTQPHVPKYNPPVRNLAAWPSRYDVDDAAIMKQQVTVDLTPAGDSDRPERLGVLAGLLMRRFERQGKLDDLEGAIKNQRAAVDLTQAGSSEQRERLGVLEGLLMRRFEHQGMSDDLDEAIKNQQVMVDLTPAGDPEKLERLSELVRLLERRLQTVGDRSSEIGSLLRASDIVPTILGGAKSLYEVVKEKLLEDLQQLSICIKRSKHQELITTIRRMENAILCLTIQDGDKLCQDIFKASTRLGAYCQALRNRAGDGTDQEELENLYKDFVRIEREFSAAHDRMSSKYEQLYKQWRADRQIISKFLSKVDSNKSQSDNLEARALLEQVDAGFERIGTVLKNEANDLENLSKSLNRFTRRPITSSDPTQVPPQPPDSSSTPSDLLKQVDDSMEALSRFDALVEKSRYTKARMIISEKSSKTTQKLEKLRTSSEYYDQESQSLSCLQTRHKNDNSRDICKQQISLCNQLSNLVGGMQRMLKATVKGFSSCKASIQGLVCRSLGDLLCDLKPYLDQAGLEVSSKDLHPDLILYDAAFQAIADTIPVHSKLLKDSLSELDKLRGA